MFYPYWRILALLILFFACLSPVLAKQPFVKIGWDPNPEVRVSGYNVYRSIGTEVPVLLNQKGLVHEARFVDRTVEKGITYTYTVTAVDLAGLESDFSTPLTLKVEQNHVPAPQTVFLPTSVSAGHPAFQNTFLGLGLLNLGDLPDPVSLIGIDGHGAQTGYDTVAAVPAHGKTSQLPDQVADLPGSTSVMVGRSSSDIHSFFLAGTKDLRSFEGVTEELPQANTLYFPISLSKTGTASLTFLNPDEKKPAQIAITARSRDGSVLARTTLALPPLGSFQGVLAQLFGPELVLEEGYVLASSQRPFEGYQLSTYDSQSLSGAPGRPASRGQHLSLPHFFFDDSGGDTQIQVINADPAEAHLQFSIRLDGSPEPEKRDLRLAPRALAVVSVRSLLGRESVPGGASGQIELTATGRDGAEATYAKVVAQANFVGNHARARASAPLRGEGTDNWIFPVVMQQRDAGFSTGLALVNRNTEPLTLTVRAVDDQGQLAAERVVEIPAGQRLVGQLDGENFFGPTFSQMGGHLEVTGDASYMAVAFFGDLQVEFLTHIGAVLR